MKILLWPTHYPPFIGGLEVLVHSLALQLNKMGHDVIVLSNGEEFADFLIDGIQVYNFPFNKALYHFDLKVIKKILDQIHTIVDTFHPDVVNVHGWFESFCFYQTRILSKKAIPLYITIHGLLEQKYYQTEACVQLWSMARGVNTVSKALIEGLEQQGCYHPSLQVIYNGLSIPSLPIVAQPLKAPELLMVGRLTEEKCFDVAFHAMKILVQKRPEIKLRLVGGGVLYHELLELKNSLGLDSWIEMTDYVPPHEVRRYIDDASIVVVPSYYESFSLVALEAALRARPVIASGVVGLKEVVAQGQTGLLIEPKDPQALADAIDTMLSDPQKMAEMGRNAHQRAVDLFSIEKTASNYLKMYGAIV